MTELQTKEAVDKIFAGVFDCKNPYTLEEILSKFAFDVRLPQEVIDSTTGETTWAVSINPTKFITNENSFKKEEWMLPKQPINSLSELLEIWRNVNLTTTERVFDSINVSQSDTIYGSENVYRSSNSNECKYLIFSDGCHKSEYLLASQRSGNCSFGLRIDDSANCSNSYNVICSGNISNSLFIQDCNSLHECMFCSHITNKRYCIANMQFEEEEYFEIKKEIIKWIINS